MSIQALAKAKAYASQINPNILIGAGIVGVIGLGGVILWRILDPSKIPEKIKTFTDDHFDTFYTKTDPTTGETTPDNVTITLATISPAFGFYNYLKKRGNIPGWANQPTGSGGAGAD